MSTDIKVTVARGSNTIAQHVMVQKDNMSIAEASYIGGGSPYFKYNMYSLAANVSFQFQDLLTDESNTDPTTGSAAKYRIVSIPEFFSIDQHWEWISEQVVGT